MINNKCKNNNNIATDKECKHHGHGEHRLEKTTSGNGYWRCLKCRQEENKRKRRRRQKFICELMENLGAKCSCCGYNESPEILHFHHVCDRKDKKFTIANAIRTLGRIITKQDVIEEVEKCVLLCPNCHAKEHTEYSYHEIMEEKDDTIIV